MVSEDAVKWAFRMFAPDDDPPTELIAELAKQCATTAAVRAYFLMRPHFIKSRKALAIRMLERALQKKDIFNAPQTELAKISEDLVTLRQRADRLNLDMLHALEIIAVGQEISRNLRELKRREDELQRSVDEAASAVASATEFLKSERDTANDR
jgi:hypothetical protein